MDPDFDLESLAHVEQSFYDAGYEDGFAHGRIHGLIEGRALGREKGFEIWEELGFYEGFGKTWRALLGKQGREQDRAYQHTRHLLESISQFPRVNPSATDASSELDVVRLVRQIRSRYKILCASLNVRPRLQPAEVDEVDLDVDMTMNMNMDMDVNEDIGTEKAASPDIVTSGASATLKQRVAPGSSIPVWKLDRTGAKKPVTNQDLDF